MENPCLTCTIINSDDFSFLNVLFVIEILKGKRTMKCENMFRVSVCIRVCANIKRNYYHKLYSFILWQRKTYGYAIQYDCCNESVQMAKA